MMKKLLFIIVLLLGCMQANAQFEAGKWYIAYRIRLIA